MFLGQWFKFTFLICYGRDYLHLLSWFTNLEDAALPSWDVLLHTLERYLQWGTLAFFHVALKILLLHSTIIFVHSPSFLYTCKVIKMLAFTYKVLAWALLYDHARPAGNFFLLGFPRQLFSLLHFCVFFLLTTQNVLYLSLSTFIW